VVISAKIKRSIAPRTVSFNIDRCRHLCCKEGKVSKRSRVKASVSNTKGINLLQQSHFENIRDNGDEGEQPLQGNNIPQSTSCGYPSEISHSDDIIMENLEHYGNENPYAIPNSTFARNVLEDTSSTSIASTIKLISVQIGDTFQHSRSRSEQVVSEKPGLENAVNPWFKRPATWSVDDCPSESDDDLPVPENLLARIMPKAGLVLNTQASSISATTRSNDVAFTMEDIMECVEIVG
jgi:hypothetical protein